MFEKMFEKVFAEVGKIAEKSRGGQFNIEDFDDYPMFKLFTQKSKTDT